MEKILIIEDDVIIGGGVKQYLESRGYEVFHVRNLSQAKKALEASFDLLLLDINLPDGNGLDFFREIREYCATPVIFLTANDTEEDIIRGFQAGCDDYVPKPFSAEILSQRVAAVLRRFHAEQEKDVFLYKGLSVDFAGMQVSICGKKVKLSATEYKLLELLIRNRGQVLTRNRIIQRIWDCDENYVDENTLNVHIRRLRQKIEKEPGNPQYIVTVFGIGYTFGRD